MKLCDECGLPIGICNALARYKDAVARARRHGFREDVEDAITQAEGYYKEYIEAFRKSDFHFKEILISLTAAREDSLARRPVDVASNH